MIPLKGWGGAWTADWLGTHHLCPQPASASPLIQWLHRPFNGGLTVLQLQIFPVIMSENMKAKFTQN